MGFEQDFEKGWRDKHWGKAIRHFAKGGTPDQISNDIKTALCGVLREMEPSGLQNSLLALLEVYTAHRDQAVFQRPFVREGAGNQEALQRFREDALPIRRSEEHSA